MRRVEVKKKAVERRDVPLHMASTSLGGLQLDGREVLMREVFRVVMVEAMPAWRVVHTQKEDVWHDPMKKVLTIKIPAKMNTSNMTKDLKDVEKKKVKGGKKTTAPRPHETRAPQYMPPPQNMRSELEKKEKTVMEHHTVTKHL